jgi:hypothetical protein
MVFLVSCADSGEASALRVTAGARLAAAWPAVGASAPGDSALSAAGGRVGVVGCSRAVGPSRTLRRRESSCDEGRGKGRGCRR